MYEGFFRYVYLFGRKDRCALILDQCEACANFEDHYFNNLSILPAYAQNDDDVLRVRRFLARGDDDLGCAEVAWLLFRKRDLSEPLNIQLLVDHVFTLSDTDLEGFFGSMFLPSVDYIRFQWRDGLGRFLNSFLKLPDDRKVQLELQALEFIVYLTAFADWQEREEVLNCLSRLRSVGRVRDAIEACRRAHSVRVVRCVGEILGS